MEAGLATCVMNSGSSFLGKLSSWRMLCAKEAALLLNGTWQCGRFSGGFAEIGSAGVPYTTFPDVPILASYSRRYS